MTGLRNFTTAMGGALCLLLGCGEPMDPNGVDGGDASAATDSGLRPSDAGFDASVGLDAGAQGCAGAGCELVELTSGTSHVCGRRANGELICWGRNQGFQLGDGRDRHEMCRVVETSLVADCSGTPVRVRYDDGAEDRLIEDAEAVMAAGFTSTCALRADELWCWSEALTPVGSVVALSRVARRALEATSVVQASVSERHSCVVTGARRALACVGQNAFGQLGDGLLAAQTLDLSPVLLDPTPTPTVALEGVLEVLVSFGSFTCARTSDSLYCWGLNSSGQLGDPDASPEVCLGGSSERFDCARSPRLVGGAAPIGATIDLAVGTSHACAITGAGASGPVVCWGDNRMGQIGRPDDVETSATPMAVAGLADATQIAVGSGTSYALHADGTVSAWGYNEYGQLGDGVPSHGASCTSGTDTGDCRRTPATVDGITDATFIVANHEHACVIVADGSAWCWGSNRNRQLGDGSREPRFTPVHVAGTTPR